MKIRIKRKVNLGNKSKNKMNTNKITIIYRNNNKMKITYKTNWTGNGNKHEII